MIELFEVDKNKGTLTAGPRVPSGGKEPWGLSLDPSGRYMFAMNHGSDIASVFRIDAANGSLTQAGPDLTLPAPVSAVFVQV